MASISQNYWGDIKEDCGSGGRNSPSGVHGWNPVEGLGDEVPQQGEGLALPVPVAPVGGLWTKSPEAEVFL